MYRKSNEQTYIQFSSVHELSQVLFFATPLIEARQASLSITNSQSLLKLMSNESLMPSNHLILCHPPLLPPSIFPSICAGKEHSLCRRMRSSVGYAVENGRSNTLTITEVTCSACILYSSSLRLFQHQFPGTRFFHRQGEERMVWGRFKSTTFNVLL